MWSILISVAKYTSCFYKTFLSKNPQIPHFIQGSSTSPPCDSNPKTVTNCVSILRDENEATHYTEFPKYRTRNFFLSLSFKNWVGGHLTIMCQNIRVIYIYHPKNTVTRPERLYSIMQYKNSQTYSLPFFKFSCDRTRNFKKYLAVNY
jgi:hypothetical protein